MNNKPKLQELLNEKTMLLEYISEAEAELGSSAFHSGCDKYDAIQIARNTLSKRGVYSRLHKLNKLIKIETEQLIEEPEDELSALCGINKLDINKLDINKLDINLDINKLDINLAFTDEEDSFDDEIPF